MLNSQDQGWKALFVMCLHMVLQESNYAFKKPKKTFVLNSSEKKVWINPYSAAETYSAGVLVHPIYISLFPSFISPPPCSLISLTSCVLQLMTLRTLL